MTSCPVDRMIMIMIIRAKKILPTLTSEPDRVAHVVRHPRSDREKKRMDKLCDKSDKKIAYSHLAAITSARSTTRCE